MTHQPPDPSGSSGPSGQLQSPSASSSTNVPGSNENSTEIMSHSSTSSTSSAVSSQSSTSTPSISTNTSNTSTISSYEASQSAFFAREHNPTSSIIAPRRSFELKTSFSASPDILMSAASSSSKSPAQKKLYPAPKDSLTSQIINWTPPIPQPFVFPKESLIQPLFQNGFESYLKSGLFADITVTDIRNRNYTCHKFILGHGSEFFKQMFTTKFQESHSNSISLSYADTYDVWPSTLRFLYTGKITFSVSNAIPLYGIADLYQIETLKSASLNFVQHSISQKNVLTFLKYAIEFQVHSLITLCLSLMSKSFFLFQKQTDLSWLPPPLFCTLLSNRYLAVASEMDIYQSILEYMEGRKKSNHPLTDDGVGALMKSVQFSKLSVQQLETVANTPQVPKSAIVDALLTKLKHSENGNDEFRSIKCIRFEIPNVTLPKQIPRGIIQTLLSSIETTHVPSDNTETQPIEIPTVKITASSRGGRQGQNLDPSVILRTDPAQQFYTQNIPSSWIIIDLGSNAACVPNYYILRHGTDSKTDLLRKWLLQASHDAFHWFTLKRHTDDSSLHDPFQVAGWPISNCPSPFRFFRLLQFGHNSNKNNFMALSGFELFGDLYYNGSEKIFP